MQPTEPTLSEATAQTILRSLDGLQKYEGWDAEQIELRNEARAALAYWQAQKARVAA